MNHEKVLGKQRVNGCKLLLSSGAMLALAGLILAAEPGGMPAHADPVADIGEPTLARNFTKGMLPEGLRTYKDDAGPFTLRFSHPAPPSSPAHIAWEGSTNGLEAMTDGAVKAQMFPSGSLHGYAEGFVAASTGITDFAACYASAEPNAFPSDRIFNLPFILPSRADLGTVVVFELRDHYLANYKNQNTIFGGKTVLTGTNLMTKEPVEKLEDLKGMKIATGSANNAEVLEALGAVPVTMTFRDYYTSLQSGLVDGLLWNDTFFGAYKIHEVTNYHTRIELLQSGIETCLSPAFHDRLPDDLKPVVNHWAQLTSMVNSQLGVMEASAKAQKVFAENDVVMITLDDAERQRWIDAVQPVVEKNIEEAEAKGVPARQMIEEIRAATKKYEGMTQDELFQHIVDNPYQTTGM